MEFTNVALDQMELVGKSINTTYIDNKCFDEVSALWQEFYCNVIQDIKNPVDFRPIGLYYGITDPLNFKFMTSLAVSKNENPGLTTITLPKSNYAKFTVVGHTFENVCKAWQIIGSMDLPRNTGMDFEVYNNDHENPELKTIDFFISIN